LWIQKQSRSQGAYSNAQTMAFNAKVSSSEEQ
jgi:hypothetical protein